MSDTQNNETIALLVQLLENCGLQLYLTDGTYRLIKQRNTNKNLGITPERALIQEIGRQIFGPVSRMHRAGHEKLIVSAPIDGTNVDAVIAKTLAEKTGILALLDKIDAISEFVETPEGRFYGVDRAKLNPLLINEYAASGDK